MKHEGKWRKIGDLGDHEFLELQENFGLDLDDGYIVVVLSKEDWETLLKVRHRKIIDGAKRRKRVVRVG